MSYVGTVVPIPLGVDGGYGTARIPATGMKIFRNLTLENNYWEKEGGAVSQNAAALTVGSLGIVGMFDWWPDAATQRFIAVGGNGAVYRDTSGWAFATTVIAAGGITISTLPPHLVGGGRETPGRNRKLFLLTGNDLPRVGSGDFTTMAAIATPPADWTGANMPVCAVLHEGRMVFAVGDTIYWSTTTDHENLTGAGSGSLPIAPGVGQGIRCLKSFRKMLIVFKYPVGIYIVDTSSATVTNWRYDGQSAAVGVAGPYGAIEIPNDLLFVDVAMKVHLLSATGVERDAASSDISTPKLGTWIEDNLSAERSPWAHLVWYQAKRRAEIACSALGAAVNNRRVAVDFNNPAVGPRFVYSDRDVAQSLAMRITSGVQRPFIGDDTGLIYQLDQSTRSKANAGYTGQAQTEDLDLSEFDGGFAGRAKNFDFLELELAGVGAYNLNANIYIDGSLKTATPLTYSLAGVGVPLGTFLLGTDRLASTSLRRVRRRLRWQGTRIGVELFNSGAAQTFRVARAFLGCRLAE